MESFLSSIADFGKKKYNFASGGELIPKSTYFDIRRSANDPGWLHHSVTYLVGQE